MIKRLSSMYFTVGNFGVLSVLYGVCFCIYLSFCTILYTSPTAWNSLPDFIPESNEQHRLF